MAAHSTNSPDLHVHGVAGRPPRSCVIHYNTANCTEYCRCRSKAWACVVLNPTKTKPVPQEVAAHLAVGSKNNYVMVFSTYYRPYPPNNVDFSTVSLNGKKYLKNPPKPNFLDTPLSTGIALIACRYNNQLYSQPIDDTNNRKTSTDVLKDNATMPVIKATI